MLMIFLRKNHLFSVKVLQDKPFNPFLKSKSIIFHLINLLLGIIYLISLKDK